jgi:aminomethyltransferase
MLDSIYPNVIPGPPRPSRILTPQGFSRHHGQERHVVPGGGACWCSWRRATG